MTVPTSSVAPRRLTRRSLLVVADGWLDALAVPTAAIPPWANDRQRHRGGPSRTVDDVPDVPFGFSLPGGMPDPNDPAQMQQFLGQLQQLFAGANEGPVNWGLARQVALAALTGGGPAGF